MARVRAPRTLFEHCVARAMTDSGGSPTSILDTLRATRHGTRVCELIMQWAIASYEVGREIATGEQYAEFWGKDDRTAWRHRAQIRELFPGDECDAVLLQVRAYLVTAGRRKSKDLTSVPIAVRRSRSRR